MKKMKVVTATAQNHLFYFEYTHPKSQTTFDATTLGSGYQPVYR